MPKKPPKGRPSHRRLKSEKWQLQTAKAKFSDLFRRALAEGPQWVTRRGDEAVVVLSAESFERLRTRSRQSQNLVEFFAESPLAKVSLDLDRNPDLGRTIEL